MNQWKAHFTRICVLTLFWVLIGFRDVGFAQSGAWYSLTGKRLNELRSAAPQSDPLKIRSVFLFPAAGKEDPGVSSPKRLTMPVAWKYEELAFFCRIEVKLERLAKIPIKFRLGEVQEVEKLEGKYK